MPAAAYDVAVIGLGAHGSAAVDQLTRRGARVVGIERFPRGGRFGSSIGHTRVIRIAYFEHAGYVPLLRRAWDLWRELEVRSGSELLLQTGGLYIGPPDREIVAGSARSARTNAIEHEILDTAEVERRFPAFRLDPGAAGFFEKRAGMLFVERCMEAALVLAERAGAELRFGSRALGLERSGSGVAVLTDAGRVLAGRVLVTAGAWTAELLPELASTLAVERVPVLWVDPPDQARFAPPAFPVFLMETADDGQFYGLPFVAGQGLKIGRHHTGEPAAAETLDRVVHPADLERVRRYLRLHMPAVAEAPLREAAVCMYTNTPDGQFLIDRSVVHDAVLYASACSGHGFKFASVIGEILADLALTGASRHEIGFLSAARLRSSGALT
ncbi:MAG: N-methyl-L-tryptophan oxidase [Chloroflexi bacterium]|nr:N-methyl-L-tryptophan oxidase [Chloroflexota bacterium]